MKREIRLLAVVACALWASAAGAAPGVVEVRLAVEEPARVEGEVQAGGVLRLRPVHPGRLEVRVGRRVLVDCNVGWGEAGRLRFEEWEARARLCLRVVNGEPGHEELEVGLPGEVVAGEEEVEVRYEWDWRYAGLARRQEEYHELETALGSAGPQGGSMGRATGSRTPHMSIAS